MVLIEHIKLEKLGLGFCNIKSLKSIRLGSLNL